MTAEDERVWRQRAEALRAAREERRRREVGVPGSGRYLIARTRAQEYALPLARVAGVIPVGNDPRLCPVPGAPPAFWSLYVVRGEVRPVFDARKLLPGNPARAEDDPDGERPPWIVLVRPAAIAPDGDPAADGAAAEPDLGLLFDDVGAVASGHTEDAQDAITAPSVAGRLVRDDADTATGGQTTLVVDLSSLLESLRADGDAVDAAGPVESDADGAEPGRRSEETGTG